MGRYIREDECFRKAMKGEELLVGYVNVHNRDLDFNWLVGFSDKENNMVYVQNGSILQAPDNKEYQLKLSKKTGMIMLNYTE